MADVADKYPLHKAVFENDLQILSRLLRNNNVAAKDKHGKSFFLLQKYCNCRNN